MKVSPFLTIFASSTNAGFFDFWGKSNVFALQVRESLPRSGLGRRFLQKYDEVKQVVRFFQFVGPCASEISSPTHELVTFDAEFNSRASPSTNIGALVNLLERWRESYGEASLVALCLLWHLLSCGTCARCRIPQETQCHKRHSATRETFQNR